MFSENFILQSLTIYTAQRISLELQIKLYEMGGACGRHGGEEKCIQGFGGET